MSIHKRIRERRLALGLASHKALADLIGVSWQTVQLWEKEGGTAPNRSRIQKVAVALKVTPEWLQHGGEVGKDDGEASAPPKVAMVAPKWMSAEAYQLLEFYYLADVRGRDFIMRTAEKQALAATPAAAGNQG